MRSGTITYIILFVCLFTTAAASAQRLQDHNIIGWKASFNTIYLSKHTSLWLEYQWRREDYVRNWQQSLARGGVQYHFNNGVSAMAGYGYIITFPYGDYAAGPHKIPEHRIFEQMSWNESIGRVSINHRLRLEQRLVGKVDQKATDENVKDWTYLNRVRYQLRATVPINHPKLQDKTWYIAAFDELFIGFGSNVNQNIFDQNRIGLLGGYQFNKMFRADAGFINQTVQQASLVTGKEVIQYNSGYMISLYFTKPYAGKKTTTDASAPLR